MWRCWKGTTCPTLFTCAVNIPPKCSVARAIELFKGRSAVRVYGEFLHERRMTGLGHGAAGYSVSTVGIDEERVRQRIRK